MKKKGFTLIELLVVIAIIAMLLAILMPALNKVKKIAQRVVCATNAKGLGTAQAVYANDYDDMFAKQGQNNPLVAWADKTAGWQITTPGGSLGSATAAWNVTVGSSLYLLVREADVSPKSFVCPSGTENEFNGANNNNFDIVELWDFGAHDYNDGDGFGGPLNKNSYAYHLPFDSTAATGASTASFAVLADKNPLMDHLLQRGAHDASNFTGFYGKMGEHYLPAGCEKWMIQQANSQPHGREGQNVAFGDGHCDYTKEPDVGVRHDNIYTYQAVGDTSILNIRQGIFSKADYMPLAPDKDSGLRGLLRNRDDSLLVSDDVIP